MYLPEGDKYSYNKTAIESQLCSLYGGRVAEELIFGHDKVTTGASNDIERATKMARNMATKWGLSDELGPIAYGEEEDEVFLGRSVTQHKNVSDDTARRIDEVVRSILDRAYNRTTQILKDNVDKLHLMAEALLQYETIDAKQIDDIMAGRTDLRHPATGPRLPQSNEKARVRSGLFFGAQHRARSAFARSLHHRPDPQAALGGTCRVGAAAGDRPGAGSAARVCHGRHRAGIGLAGDGGGWFGAPAWSAPQ